MDIEAQSKAVQERLLKSERKSIVISLGLAIFVFVLFILFGLKDILQNIQYSIKTGVPFNQVKLVQEQQRMWLANPTCGIDQTTMHAGSDGVQVDAIICPNTGDILVTVKRADGKIFVKFVSPTSLVTPP